MIPKRRLKDEHFLNKFNDLYNVKIALDNCIFIYDDFIDDFKYELSKTGEKLFKYLKRRNPEINDDTIRFSIFKEFYHNDIFIDIDSIDLEYIYQKISEWIIAGYIKFPWIFGRELYDKYFFEFKNQKKLDFHETAELLHGTSKGVFQIENLLITPFGLLKSSAKRNIFPRLKFPLWHCPDLSCPGLHAVQLENVEGNILDDLFIDIEYYNSNKDVININEYLQTFSYDFYDPYSLEGLFELIISAFNDDEFKIITESIIKGKIRLLLPKQLSKGSLKDLCQNLSKPECLSLLLLTNDLTILEGIDSLINENIIVIPNTEIRESNLKTEFGHYETYLQCNKLGIRVNASFRDLSIVKLKKLIKESHDDFGLENQLEWKLRKYDNTLTTNQKLDKYVHCESPLNIISELLLSGPRQTEKVISLLPGMTSKDSYYDEEFLKKKIAWKLGFDINIYPPYLNDFWTHLKVFKETVLLATKYNEEDKVKIRSNAVNLFVSMEDILQQSLAFTTWALLSDHYQITKFKYIYEDARDFMVAELDNFQLSSNLILKFEASGKNTLFPLIQGFRGLLMKCDELINNSEIHKRNLIEFPSFYRRDPLTVFPFEHKKFILDVSELDYRILSEHILNVIAEFGKGDIIEIRNRLQHNRQDFPNQDEILNAVTSIEKAFSIIENEGICPNVFLFKNSITDEYNRHSISLVNYKGTEIQYFFTPELDGSHIPSPLSQIITINCIKVKYTNQPLRFEYKEKSTYQNYWKDYPRKKPKQGDNDDLHFDED